MIELLIWIPICFLIGSIPFSIIISKLIASTDIRRVGDGNPGSANIWKSSGWFLGLIALTMDLGKSLIPVYYVTTYLQHPTSIFSDIVIALVALSPILGHAYSPFLRLRGGKALASSWGSWIALTGGLALPIGFIFLGAMHLLQKNHAITVTFCVAGFLIVFFPIIMRPYIALFWVSNMVIIVYKHRSEYSGGISLRNWVFKLAGRSIV